MRRGSALKRYLQSVLAMILMLNLSGCQKKQVSGMTLARVRKLIEAECHDRNWLMQDVDWFEKDSHDR